MRGTAFSLLASLAQWGLLEARLVSPLMVASSPMLSGGVLVATGLFQFTQVKEGCLFKCRNPFLLLRIGAKERAGRSQWVHGTDSMAWAAVGY
jgi:predicted metal-binding membrane protein